MKLVAGPASTHLAEKIADKTGLELIKLEHKIFPDGESYLRFPEEIEGEDLVVIQGTHPPQDRHLIQAYLIAETALDLGAGSVTLVSPYLAYARQDKRFRPGEPISILSVLKLLKSAGYGKIYTVNIHSPWIAEKSPMPLIDLHAEKALADYLKELKREYSHVVSVGKKGEKMAGMVADELGADYLAAKSSRDRVTGKVSVELEASRGLGKVLIVDDIISTGGTMVKVIKAVRKLGAEEVDVACIHGLMAGNAVEKIISAGAREIISSDTIPSDYSKYSVAGVIAEALMRGK